MTPQDHIKVVLTSSFYHDNRFYMRNCSTYNFPLPNNIKSVFDSAIIIVADTPYPFIFSSITGRQRLCIKPGIQERGTECGEREE